MENEVRLLNDRVQICHNGVWGYVCTINTQPFYYYFYYYYTNTDWTDEDASVVCRELGFHPQSISFICHICHIYYHILI